MTETQMVEVLHVILETIFVFIPRIFFQILMKMFFSKFSSQRLNLLQLTISIKLTTKLMKYIFSEILTSIHFKMDGKLILKENQSYELKILFLLQQLYSLTPIIKEPTWVTYSTPFSLILLKKFTTTGWLM